MAIVHFDEKEVLNGCLRQDVGSQRLLYEHHKVVMFTTCLRYVSNRADAEDILQDGFLQIFKELHQYDTSRGALGAWMRKVMINTALQAIRKNKMSFVEMNEVQMPLQTNEDIVSSMTLAEIMKHIQELPNGYRTVFNLYVIDGFQHNDIAEMLNISTSTSKTQLFKAKQLLKKSLSDVSSCT